VSHGGRFGSDFLPDISQEVHVPTVEEASASGARAGQSWADDLPEFHVLHDEAGQPQQSGFEQVLWRLGVRKPPEHNQAGH